MSSGSLRNQPMKEPKKYSSELLDSFPLLRILYKRSFGHPLQRRKAKEGKKTKQGAERLSLGSPYSPKAGSDESCTNAVLKVS